MYLIIYAYNLFIYIDFLFLCISFLQKLIEKLKAEVAGFMNYLQDVSKVCADDYNFMPMGATRYLEVQRYSYSWVLQILHALKQCLLFVFALHLRVV